MAAPSDANRDLIAWPELPFGIELADDEARDIEAWLGSLTGDVPRDYIARPQLPAEPRR